MNYFFLEPFDRLKKVTSVKIKYTKNAFIKLRCNLVNRSMAKPLFYILRKLKRIYFYIKEYSTIKYFLR